ncbi:MAG: hypothetical protein Q8Q31_02525 [Nanoarchaeota archaeon]|nr:hypothetical protein [Nanoarchaeota archaeon]
MEKIIHKPLEKGKNVPALVTTPFTIDPTRREVALSQFIYVPQKKVYITKIPFKFERLRLNWEDSHYFLADLGFFMPDIATFMTHYINVRNASLDTKTLYYADGKDVKVSEAYSIWQGLNSYSKHGSSCVTWLDNIWSIKESLEYSQEKEIIMSSQHFVRRGKSGLELRGKERTITMPKNENYNSSVRLPLSDEGMPLEWVTRENCALGVSLYFKMPQMGRVTQYSSGQDECMIDCTADKGRGPTMLYACAHSTLSLK